jgi:FkbM family methyltransferase
MLRTTDPKMSLRMAVARTICGPLPPILAQRLRKWVYPEGAALRDDCHFVVRGVTGSPMKGHTGDYHAYRFGVHGYFEWRSLAIARALCEPGDVVLDVGANIGTESIGYADIVGPSGRVFAFEPLPTNLAVLAESARLHPFGNVTVLPVAVGERCETLRFTPPAVASDSGVGHLAAAGEDVAATIEVECVTLDSMADRLGPARAIFMDVEGAEMLALRGGRNYIAAQRPAIVLEADERWLARAGSSPSALAAELAGQSYRIFRISRLGLAPVDPEELGTQDAARWTNWLCLHEAEVWRAEGVRKLLRRCGLLPCIAGLNPLSGSGAPAGAAR